MKQTNLLIAAAFLFIGFFTFRSLSQPQEHQPPQTNQSSSSQKIQVAILLDVSNSMDGLIDQAKAQLWNMVNTMGKATCNGAAPKIEIALYEYGRETNNAKEGFVKQLSGFSTDLDKLSNILFSLKTNGGDEYCGQVIYTSLNQLSWDNTPGNYKVIFIAGNEDFLQGNLNYKKACDLAKEKGVIVNTIYCGDRMQGLSEHWNVNDECGGGSFTNINQDAKIEEMATPYDDVILSLNDTLNNTYLYYGTNGNGFANNQKQLDQKNYSVGKSVAVKRSMVKSKSTLYENANWDLVDKVTEDKDFVNKVDVKTLPDSLRNKSKAEIQKIVLVKKGERTKIQQKISENSILRDKFIATEKAKKSGKANVSTLETEIEKIIRKQAKGFKMIIP